jgi:SH3-like domain-containing protein
VVTGGVSAEALPAPVEATTPAPAPTTAAAAPAGLPAVLYVANTDGQGAYIRTQPRDGVDTRVFAWNDGTPLVPLELRTVGEGSLSTTWVRVRDPRGQEGWLRQAYLAASR